MTDNTCHFCKLEIAPGALKCHHCLSDQQPKKEKAISVLLPALSIALALISITSFALVGLPDLAEKTLRNKAIVEARFSHGYHNPTGEKGISILVANYGLQSALFISKLACYTYDGAGNIIKDEDGSSYPELFTASQDNNTVDGKTAKTLDFTSEGGLPLDEGALASADLHTQRCNLEYTSNDLSGTSEAVKTMSLEIEFPYI